MAEIFGKLKKRSDFLALQNNSPYIRARSVGLQVCFVKLPGSADSEDFSESSDEDSSFGSVSATSGVSCRPALVFVGFTTSRKVGNAVLRNRARRRLRAWVRERLASCLDALSEEEFQASPVRTVSLSKATWRAFEARYPRKAQAVKSASQRGGRLLALVFIANKSTPTTPWTELDQDLRGAVKRMLKTPFCENSYRPLSPRKRR